MKLSSTVFVLVFAAVTACSSMKSNETERETTQRFFDHAGDPIESFSYLGRLDRWRTLGRDRLVVWTALDKAYLLTVSGMCPDLESATKIGVTSKSGTDVSRGFDSVLLPNGQRCTISEIRPIDYEAMKKDERDAENRVRGY